MREEWTRIPVLKPWLEIITGDTQHVRCKVCNIKLTAKKSALIKHAECQTHQEQIGKLSSAVEDDPSETTVYVVLSEDGVDDDEEDDESDEDEDEPIGGNAIEGSEKSQLKENRYV